MAHALEALLGAKEKRRGWAVFCCVLAVLLIVLLLTNLSAVGAAISEMATYLEYKFIQRALIVGTLVSLCAALLGVILVLKRYSMIGDGLSHVGFGSLTVAVSMGVVTAEALPEFLPEGLRAGIAGLCGMISESPLVFTLVVVVICATLLLRISKSSRLRGDSAIALISTSSLALGVIVSSSVSGMNIDVYNYMFGSILAMSESDVYISVALSVVVLMLFVMFYSKIFAVTFDENFSKATGMNAGVYRFFVG